MKAAVVVFPGSNCDRDCAVAVERSTGAKVDIGEDGTITVEESR